MTVYCHTVYSMDLDQRHKRKGSETAQQTQTHKRLTTDRACHCVDYNAELYVQNSCL